MRKPTKEELSFYFVFENPIAFREFWLPRFMPEFRRVRYYQYPHAHATHLIEFDGRGTGKTDVGLRPDMCQNVFNSPRDSSVLTTYRQHHVTKPLNDIVFWFRSDPYWREFLVTARQQPTYCITFKNGHVLWGISVGDSKQAEAITGIHPSTRFIDEFQFYPAEGWKQFLGTTSEKGTEHTIDKFTGVPDGRIDTPASGAWKFDPDNPSKFDNCRISISRRLVPYYTSSDLAEARSKYRDDQEFKQEVDGEWGEPMWGYWDWPTIKTNINPDLIPCIIIISQEDYRNVRSPAPALIKLPPRPSSAIDCIIGMDYGYTEPTVIYPMFLIGSRWRAACRINLTNKMIDDHQAEIVDYLMETYQATLCGIDFTGEKGVVTTLQNDRGRFSGKNYADRIVPVEFNSKMIVGRDERGREIKEEVKLKTSGILREMFAERQFEFFRDFEFQSDFNNERSAYTSHGKTRIVTPHNVHIPESLRCFAFAYFTKYGTISVQKQVKYEFILPESGKGSLF